MSDLEQAIKTPDFETSRTYWMERCIKAEALCERFLHDPPAQMSTPLGMLPINAEGMRQLSDALGRAQRTLKEIATELDHVNRDMSSLSKLL